MAASKRSNRRRRWILPAVAAAGLSLVLALGLGSVSAAPVNVMGKKNPTPPPSCPTPDRKNVPDFLRCSAYGQVTGYQRIVDGKKGLYRIKRSGKIVAWSVRLSRKPGQEELNVFTTHGGSPRYGNGPTAGLSIIRRTKSGKFRLKRKSPIVRVGQFYGEQPIFTLERPLKVRKGDIVALTTATWLTNFAIKDAKRNRLLGRNNVWVASRAKKNCTVPNSVPVEDRAQWFFDHTNPHTKLGSERGYGCVYDRARLLYWAWFVPSS